MNIFSTKSRYGARLMLELALHFYNGSITLQEISKRQDISEKYLSQLIIPLKSAKLVNSTRGSRGGYTLARKPSEITMLEVVSALEGEIEPVDCVKKAEGCGRSARCATRAVWCEVELAVKNTLQRITLQNVIDKHEELQNIDSFTYYI